MLFNPVKLNAGISGFPSPAADYCERDLSLDQLLVANPNSTFFGIASGESMKDCGIWDGDLVVVDRKVVRSSGKIVVACLNGEMVIKLLDKERRQLCSANADYEPITVTEHDDFAIEGVVVCSIRIFDPSILQSL